MEGLANNHCKGCGADLIYERGGTTYSRVIGVEYPYGSPERYDGVSEWQCPDCGRREGRWTGKVLEDGEIEKRFGDARLWA